MASDLTAAIRKQLAAYDDENYRSGSYWGREEMRDALLAVVDYVQRGESLPGERDSRDHSEKAIDAEVEAQFANMLGLIAEKLGIEVADG